MKILGARSGDHLVVKESSDEGWHHFNLYLVALFQARNGAPPPSSAKWSCTDTDKDGAVLSLLLVGASGGPDCFFKKILGSFL